MLHTTSHAIDWDIQHYPKERGIDEYWAIIGDFTEIFDVQSNHEIADLLEEISMKHNGEQDPENSGYYVYFQSEDDAIAWTESVNEFLTNQ